MQSMHAGNRLAFGKDLGEKIPTRGQTGRMQGPETGRPTCLEARGYPYMGSKGTLSEIMEAEQAPQAGALTVMFLPTG